MNNYIIPQVLLIIVPLLIIGSLFHLWSTFDHNLNELRNESKNNYHKIYRLRSQPAFKIEFDSLNRNQIVVSSKELQKINDQIEWLSNEVQLQVVRTETVIDKDLSRLGTYMAVGIGFMTILGIFIPMGMNYINFNEVKEKIRLSENTLGGITTRQTDLDNRLARIEGNIQTSESRSNALEFRLNEFSPNISLLTLQNSIARFFNANNVILSNAVRSGNFQDAIALFTQISVSLRQFQNTTNGDIRNTNFIMAIRDFIRFLELSEIQLHPAFSDRTMVDALRELALALRDLIADPVNEATADERFQNVSERIDVITNLFRNREVQRA